MALSNKKSPAKKLAQQPVKVEESVVESKVEKSVTEKASTTKKVIKTKTIESIVVKNISNFTQHHNGVYYSPNLEMRTELSDFVKSSIDAGTFVVIEGK